MDIAVVIINWNKAALTRHCLAAAQRATSRPARWIVVDNGSAEPIGALPPGVTLLSNAHNLGFAGGANTGLKHAFAAGAEYVWLLNNDAEPLPGALDDLLATAQADPAIGLASSVILNADAGDAIDWHGGLWQDGSYLRTTDPTEYASWASNAPNRIWLVGTAMLVTRRLTERIGYFDEALFAYWEDNDISRRSTSAGFRNVVAPGSFVRHSAGSSAEHIAQRPPYYHYYMTRNEILLHRKTGDGLRPFYWLLRRTARLYQKPILQGAQRRAIRRGITDGLLGRGGPYRA
jgi:N-acetylglucosaminyl-diphospho-decaprenol L-rhamnosyltransferase